MYSSISHKSEFKNPRRTALTSISVTHTHTHRHTIQMVPSNFRCLCCKIKRVYHFSSLNPILTCPEG